jgi:DNA-binding LacI/PurR family transcriptional regulator
MKHAPPKEHSVARASDVAKLAGVSQSAVSRAFTAGASIAPQTREAILHAAATLGYQPNLIARSLISGRSNLVGVGVGNLENPFLAESLERLSISLRQAGLRLLLFSCDENAVVRERFEEVLQYRLDALVLLSTSLSPDLARQCRQSNVPVILYNRVAASGPAIASVTGDNYAGGRAIGSFLLAGKHNHFAFMAGTQSSTTSHQREDGFRSALQEAGIDVVRREEGLFTRAGAVAASRRLFAARDRPDAVFCANDFMALTAIDVAQSEFGLTVGRDVSIVGFDDVPMAAWPTFSLTSFSQSTQALVDLTVDIVRQFRLGDLTPVQHVAPGGLVIRNSARRPQRLPTP